MILGDDGCVTTKSNPTVMWARTNEALIAYRRREKRAKRAITAACFHSVCKKLVKNEYEMKRWTQIVAKSK